MSEAERAEDIRNLIYIQLLAVRGLYGKGDEIAAHMAAEHEKEPFRVPPEMVRVQGQNYLGAWLSAEEWLGADVRAIDPTPPPDLPQPLADRINELATREDRVGVYARAAQLMLCKIDATRRFQIKYSECIRGARAFPDLPAN